MNRAGEQPWPVVPPGVNQEPSSSLSREAGASGGNKVGRSEVGSKHTAQSRVQGMPPGLPLHLLLPPNCSSAAVTFRCAFRVASGIPSPPRPTPGTSRLPDGSFRGAQG
jgi:hypothetical protein